MLANLAREAESDDVGEVVAALAKAAASLPDAQLDEVHAPLAALARRCLGIESATTIISQLLQGLACSRAGAAPDGLSLAEARGIQASPMTAAQLVLGAVRLSRALAMVPGRRICVYMNRTSSAVWPSTCNAKYIRYFKI